MKWASLTRGRLARKRGVELTPLDADKPILVDFRILDGNDHGRILEYAAQFALSRHVPAKDGEGAYEFGKDVMTVLLSVTDPESADDKPEPFFGSVSEVFQALDHDRIVALARQQRFFQDTTSPFQFAMTADEFAAKVVAIATAEEGDDDPFVTMPLAMQSSFVRSLASRFLSSLELSSNTSSAAAPTTKPS